MNRTRLKYYLRALGVGIVVTALLMGYSQRGQAQMTDEEILARAAELGMTELATATPKPDESLLSAANQAARPTPSPGAQPTASPAADSAERPTGDSTASPVADSAEQPTASPAAQPTAAPKVDSTASPVADSAVQPAATSTAAPKADSTASPVTVPTVAPDGEVVTLVINRGESSVTVSKSLQALGLVEDYREYDRFLCDNGYDHSISTGTYEIPLGVTDEEIARIITKKR